MYAQYPDLSIAEIPAHAFEAASCHVCWLAELYLRPDMIPIRRYPQFEVALNRMSADSLTAILATAWQQPKEIPSHTVRLRTPPRLRHSRRVPETERPLQLPDSLRRVPNIKHTMERIRGEN